MDKPDVQMEPFALAGLWEVRPNVFIDVIREEKLDKVLGEREVVDRVLDPAWDGATYW